MARKEKKSGLALREKKKRTIKKNMLLLFLNTVVSIQSHHSK